MADEEKVEETVEEKPEDVVSKISKLRKLGFSPIASILVLVLSTPRILFTNF